MTADLTSPRRWFAPIPARRLRLVEIVTFGYAAAWLVVRVGYVADVGRLPEGRFEPIGVLSRLETPPAQAFVMLVWAAAVAGCACAAAGLGRRVAAPIGAAGMLIIATLTSSFGQVFHTEHLLVIHLAVLAVAVIVEPPSRTPSGWPLNLMMAVVVVTYVDAGIAKLRWSGVDWVTGDVLRNWVAIDNLRKWQVSDLSSAMGGWLVGVSWGWLPLAAVTLAIELGAPVALIAGRIRYVWVAAAWAFHVGILVFMAISFPYQLLGVAYAAFLPLDAWERAVVVRSRSRLPRSATV